MRKLLQFSLYGRQPENIFKENFYFIQTYMVRVRSILEFFFSIKQTQYNGSKFHLSVVHQREQEQSSRVIIERVGYVRRSLCG